MNPDSVCQTTTRTLNKLVIRWLLRVISVFADAHILGRRNAA
jgi:hypothetical protein